MVIIIVAASMILLVSIGCYVTMVIIVVAIMMVLVIKGCCVIMVISGCYYDTGYYDPDSRCSQV